MSPGRMGKRHSPPAGVAISPMARGAVTALIIFVCEILVMTVFHSFQPGVSPFVQSLVDASVLSIVILPMLSLLLVRPLTKHINELKTAEESITAIISSAGEGIVAVDGEMKIQLVNQELLSIFGYREDELTGEKISILAPAMAPDRAAPGATGFLKDILQVTGRWVKITGRRKNGDHFPMETRIEKASSAHGGDMYVVALRDITEREAAQKALLESEEKFRSSFESSSIGMVQCALDGKFLQVNNAFCAMTGYTKKEILSKTFTDITHPEDVNEDLGHVSRAIKGEISSFQMEKRYIHKNGSTVWVSLSVALVRGAAEAPRFFIAQILDITEKKKTELELIRAKEEAEESTLLKDKFVSLVAHDLRSPFVSITGLLKLLMADSDNRLSERQALMVKTALAAGEQSVGLIDELLNISRLKTGVIKPKRRFLDARQVALSAAASLGYAASRKSITISVKAQERERIFADPRLYSEVINNLLSNAIKFSHPGSVVEIAPLAGGRAGLCVMDKGVGVPVEYAGKIFRYDEKTQTKGTMGETGTGLGLPLSYDIMLAHGGLLEFTSRPGEGTAFYAVLPKITPRILVVERDRAILRMLENGLSGEEVLFSEAADYQTARAILEKTVAHLALVDIENGPEEGAAFISHTANAKQPNNLPVIAITGAHQAGEAERALAAGADDFVTKPLDMEALLARVRRFIV